MKFSVVIPTKNDEQNRHLATVLGELERLPIETIVVDWGSEEPLTLSGWFKAIRVPPGVAAEYNGGSYFAYITATNVGLRRATGEYLSYFGNETFFDESLLEWLETARPDELYFIGRKNVDRVEDKHTAPVSKMTRNLHAGGGMVAYRDIWWRLRGFDERMIYWGWMDHEIRVRAQLAQIPIKVVYHVPVYHLRHGYPRMRRARKINERVFSTGDGQPD